MAEMKTLNGYEVVDQTARDKISNLSTEVDTRKITLRDNYNTIIGNIIAAEADLSNSVYYGGKLVEIGNSSGVTQLFERGYKVPKLVAILKRTTEIETSTTLQLLRFNNATVFDSVQGSFIKESDGYGYFRINRHGAYKITVRAKWGKPNSIAGPTYIGVSINGSVSRDIDRCGSSFSHLLNSQEFTTILILNINDTVKFQISANPAYNAYQAIMYIERVA